jgi:hypothetical protein
MTPFLQNWCRIITMIKHPYILGTVLGIALGIFLIVVSMHL